ncbi:MAG TPA: helix-turn-helix domain-containing protein [Candidatus Limnocylindrales bacterium]|nr:helix-turn-helix domain-containing protein [Candidatus Limnocylindrales bacterium]
MSDGTPAADWLSLGPASRLVGVDPDTLRRWADDGRVEAFTTPGGHRRFARRSLDRLVAVRRAGRAPLVSLGATPESVSRAYRRSYASARRADDTGAVALGATDRAAFRSDGRALVEALLAFLDARDLAARTTAEAAAESLTDDLATRLSTRGTTLTEAVALFVAARRPFLAQLGAMGRRRSLDAARLAAAYEDASTLLDRLLLRLIATHQSTAR